MKALHAAVIIGALLTFASPSVAHAARTVKGRITDKNGNAASNVRVKAMDRDTFSPDDEMGRTMTNANGGYEIHYAGQHWDSGWTPNWRPDIYIRVSYRAPGTCDDGEWNDEDHWVFLQDSSAHGNHRMRDDLTINMQLTDYPRSNPNVQKFELFKDMFCEVDFFFHTSCFACAANGEKIEWTEWGISGVPSERERCWTSSSKTCSNDDFSKIKEGPQRVDPEIAGPRVPR